MKSLSLNTSEWSAAELQEWFERRGLVVDTEALASAGHESRIGSRWVPTSLVEVHLVASGPTQQPAQPTPSGAGVFCCARPIDGWYESWRWWLAPFCHAYLQIGDWTRGFGRSSPTESPNDGRSRKCWEATKRSTGTMTVAGQTINCADATIEQVRQCVKDLANSGGVCQDYGLVCNNCGDWVMDIIGACCLDGTYLPYLVY